MKRRTAVTWQPIAADMPAGILLEIKRRNGAVDLGVRLPPHWLMRDTILIARLDCPGEITDAVAWRDAPSRDPMPANTRSATRAAFDETEEKIAA